MKRIIISLFCHIISFTAFCQTQKGIVLESTITAGQQRPLQDVSLQVKGNINSVLTNARGEFTFERNSLEDKKAFTLIKVYKKGFELADPSLIGRKLAYSKKAPVNVVMLSSKVINQKKTDIENAIYESVLQHYSSTIQSLTDSLAIGKLNKEAYMVRTAELQKQFDLYEPLITSLADHYVRMDYGKMNESDARVCKLVMEGRITEADSLLNILEHQLQLQKVAHKREKEDVVNDLYNKYAISLARFDLEQAQQYIYLRAEVDNCNVGCLVDAGAFAMDYASDFLKSADYYERALRISAEQYGTNSEMYALCLNHKGGLLLTQSKFDESLECRKQALKIRTDLFGENHNSVAVCYNNMANIYYSMGKMVQAEECARKSVEIYHHLEDYTASDYSASLNTLGGILLTSGNWDEAITLLEESTKICDEVYGEMNLYSAVPINDMAVIKDYQKKYDESISLYYRAKEIYEKAYGNKHPYVATIYSNLGDSYKQIQQYDSAYVYQNKALEMRLDLFGELHEDVAISLNNLGSLFSSMKQHDIAVDLYGKCLSVWEAIIGKDNERFATTLGNIGIVYYRQKEYGSALAYFEEALEFYAKHPEQYTDSIKSIGELAVACFYYLQQDVNVDQNELQKDLNIFKSKYATYILN